jgi:hypothetical protein
MALAALAAPNRSRNAIPVRSPASQETKSPRSATAANTARTKQAGARRARRTRNQARSTCISAVAPNLSMRACSATYRSPERASSIQTKRLGHKAKGRKCVRSAGSIAFRFWRGCSRSLCAKPSRRTFARRLTFVISPHTIRTRVLRIIQY